MNYAAYYTSTEWYARRATVQRRAGRACEFCRRRPLMQVHHRSYARFRQEPLADLMGVCSACHRWIHGMAQGSSTLTCAPDSLLACGDTGLGSTPPWEAYLQAFDSCPSCGEPLSFGYRWTREGRKERIRAPRLCGACLFAEGR
jgi:hypothetical protein